jgi:hypothetical protein
MSLQLQVLSGHRYGDSLVFEETTSVGRMADVSFDDAKMSKIHAIFELTPLLGWMVRDDGSKNGMLVNNERTTEKLLEEGDLLEIGATQFRVSSVSSISALWKPQLNQLLIEALDKVKNGELTLYPFRQIPVLTFVQGIQTGEKFILPYGPRFFGGECEDIQMFEPLCPDHAFELRRNSKGVLFFTNYPKIVRLNKKEIDKKVLKKGDQIHIHNSVIEVDFLTL